jgi:hypothetical protein
MGSSLAARKNNLTFAAVAATWHDLYKITPAAAAVSSAAGCHKVVKIKGHPNRDARF